MQSRSTLLPKNFCQCLYVDVGCKGEILLHVHLLADAHLLRVQLGVLLLGRTSRARAASRRAEFGVRLEEKAERRRRADLFGLRLFGGDVPSESSSGSS
jgi:hypothetical protein